MDIILDQTKLSSDIVRLCMEGHLKLRFIQFIYPDKTGDSFSPWVGWGLGRGESGKGGRGWRGFSCKMSFVTVMDPDWILSESSFRDNNGKRDYPCSPLLGRLMGEETIHVIPF